MQPSDPGPPANQGDVNPSRSSSAGDASVTHLSGPLITPPPSALPGQEVFPALPDAFKRGHGGVPATPPYPPRSEWPASYRSAGLPQCLASQYTAANPSARNATLPSSFSQGPSLPMFDMNTLYGNSAAVGPVANFDLHGRTNAQPQSAYVDPLAALFTPGYDGFSSDWFNYGDSPELSTMRSSVGQEYRPISTPQRLPVQHPAQHVPNLHARMPRHDHRAQPPHASTPHAPLSVGPTYTEGPPSALANLQTHHALRGDQIRNQNPLAYAYGGMRRAVNAVPPGQGRSMQVLHTSPYVNSQQVQSQNTLPLGNRQLTHLPSAPYSNQSMRFQKTSLPNQPRQSQRIPLPDKPALQWGRLEEHSAPFTIDTVSDWVQRYSLENHHQQEQQPRPFKRYASQRMQGPPSKRFRVDDSELAAPLPKPNPEDIPQKIVTNYNDYKWPVKLYEIDPDKTGGNHAQPWLDSQLSDLPAIDPSYRHLSHITDGFIDDGNALTFLVAHNAANPFSHYPPPNFTTSIGVYGYYWQARTPIFWTTWTSDLRLFFAEYEKAGFIREVKRWTPDMPANQKRFHRAYWLAARMLPLRNLLNTQLIDNIVDVVDEEGAKELEGEEPGNEWPVMMQNDCTTAWNKCLQRLKTIEEVGDGGLEHIALD